MAEEWDTEEEVAVHFVASVLVAAHSGPARFVALAFDFVGPSSFGAVPLHAEHWDLPFACAASAAGSGFECWGRQTGKCN